MRISVFNIFEIEDLKYQLTYPVTLVPEFAVNFSPIVVAEQKDFVNKIKIAYRASPIGRVLVTESKCHIQ